MPYTLVRIDFSDDPNCQWCRNALRSGKVRILVDENGAEVQAGPTCARNHAQNPDEKVPDLTRATLELDEPEPGVGPVAGGNPGNGRGRSNGQARNEQQERIRRDRAVSYLLLRAEKLVDFKDVFTDKIGKVYQCYLVDEMTDGDFDFLDNLMVKVKNTWPKLSLRNLQATYACHYWMERFLEQEDKPFIQSLQAQLKLKLYLTPTQVGKLNECLEEQNRPLAIDPDAFVR